MGLWVSRGIVRKHGGSHSRPQPGDGDRSGTVFSVFLPYDRRPAGLPDAGFCFPCKCLERRRKYNDLRTLKSSYRIGPIIGQIQKKSGAF